MAGTSILLLDNNFNYKNTKLLSMKKNIIFIGIIALLAVFAFYNPNSDAKIGHVDTEYIFSKIPKYQEAQKQLNTLAEQYKAEVESKYKEVDSLYKIYQKEEMLLSSQMKKQKEDDIVKKENEAKELQKKYFGQDGLMDKKRDELLKPIQDNVFNTIKTMAKEGGYDYIFDKSTGSLLYAKPTLDQSDALLKKMGY